LCVARACPKNREIGFRVDLGKRVQRRNKVNW